MVREGPLAAPLPSPGASEHLERGSAGAVAGAGWEAALSAPTCVGLTPAANFRSHSGEVTEGTGGESHLPGRGGLFAG